MNWKQIALVVFTVFLAELGDKTQLTVLSYTSTDPKSKWIIFFGASFALVLSTLLAVVFGKFISQYVNPKWLNYTAATLFIVLGIVLFVQTYRSHDTAWELSHEIEELASSKCAECPAMISFIRHFEREHDMKLTLTLEEILESDTPRSMKESLRHCGDCDLKKMHEKLHKDIS